MVQVGTQFNDTFTLGDETLPAQDTVIGLDASDILTTDETVGGSVLFGNRDNDSLTSRSAENVLYGGQENDQLLSLAGGSLFFGDLGDDLFDAFGGTGKDTVYGGTSDGNQTDGDDVIVFSNASAGSNWGNGNTGDDFLSGSGFGNDTLWGGKGDDTIQVVEVSSSGTGSNTGFAPQNTAISNINISVTTTSGTGTGSGVDVVDESGVSAPNNNGKNYLSGDLGKDLIYGIGDRDSLFGGEDTDTLVLLGNIANASNNNLEDEDNTTALNGVPQNAYLDGGAGTDSIEAYGGLRGRNTVMGGEGDDTIKNYGVQSYIEGNEGNDTLLVDSASTDLATPSGQLYGRNTLMGGTGNDFVNVANNDGSTSGGTNLLWGGEGADTLIGSNPDVTDPNAPGDTLYGGDAAGVDESNDSLTAGNNSLMFGNKGSDTLEAIGTGSTLWGGQGTDSLLGAGTAYLSGDLGNDTLTVLAATADNTLEGGDGNDLLYGLNQADGAAGGGSNSLSGGAGNDILVAGTTVGNNDGNDTLIGGAGNDFFWGSTGDDSLGGQEGTTREGSDTLYGGQGNDSLIGTSGFDGFYYANSIEIGADSLAADTITSFQSGTDKIYLRAGSDTRINSFGNANSALGGGAGNALRDALDFEAVTYDYAASGTFSGDGTIQPAIVFQDTGDGGGLLYWDWSGAETPDTAANLSVIAVIRDGRVQASDIVLF